MNAERVASRYSKSLLDLAIERKVLEETKSDVELVLGAINESRELRNFLVSPVIKPSQKLKALDTIFGGKVSELTSMFISLLVKKGRDAMLHNVFEMFMRQYLDHHNLLEANFEVSAKVDDKTMDTLKQQLEKATGKSIIIKEQLNPELIGGYVVDMQNYRLDASVAGGLKKLKRELTK